MMINDAEQLSRALLGDISATDCLLKALKRAGGLKALLKQIDQVVDLPRQWRAQLIAMRDFLVQTPQKILHYQDEAGLQTHLHTQFALFEQEVFWMMSFAADGYLIQSQALFYGGLSQARVYPREVLKQALRLNAAFVVIAHNHLSGHCRFSESDVRMTQRLGELLAAVEIELTGHYLLADNMCENLLFSV